MANDDDVRRLMEQILPNFKPCFVFNLAESAIPDSFVPSGYITRKFLSLFKIVLSIRQITISKRWNMFWAISMLRAFSSYEMYLRYVMFACDFEMRYSTGVFGKFVSTCALVITLIKEAVDATEVDFSDLAVDIVMVFYQMELKAEFCERGDLQGFSQYVRNCYFYWRSYFRDDVNIEQKMTNLVNSLEKNSHEESKIKPEENTHKDVMNNNQCLDLAKIILSITKVKLPYLPKSNVLMDRIRAFRERQKELSEKSVKKREDNAESKTQADCLTEDLKKKNPKTYMKSGMQVDVTKTEMPVEYSFQAPVDDSKDEAPVDDSKDEAPVKVSKDRAPVMDSKDRSPVKDSKDRSPVEDSKDRSPVEDSKHEAQVDNSTSETLTDDLKSEKEQRIFDECLKSQVNDLTKQDTSMVWCKNIVQLVLKYNASKESNPTDVNYEIQEEAAKTLERLEKNITFLIKILDNSDEERDC